MDFDTCCVAGADLFVDVPARPVSRSAAYVADILGYASGSPRGEADSGPQ